MDQIPDQLCDDPYLIKIHPPDANVENPGKKPVNSAVDGPFYSAEDESLQQWINQGGNVGRALVDDLIVIDVDSDILKNWLQENYPSTFTVETGSGGQHWYYYSSWDENRQLYSENTDLGSIRSDSWQVVIPPSRHPSDRQYTVLNDIEIASVDCDAVDELLAAVTDQQPTHGAAGGGTSSAGGARRVGSSPAVPEVPSDYPNRDVSVNTARRWVEGNDLDDRFDRAGYDDESGDDWVLCKCMAEGGFSVDVIQKTMDEHRVDEAKWHRRGDEYQLMTVMKAIQAACEDEFVDFSSTADMGAEEASERRKTEVEEAQSSTATTEVNPTMADFTDHEEVTVLEGDEDGDSFKKVARTTREEDGETVEYISLKKGRVELVQTVDGEEVLAQRVTDSKSLGSPEYVGELAEALAELDEKVNGDD